MNSEASQLRDQDLVKWIENKLGDANEHWSGPQAASLLTKPMIIELENCFQEFEPHVKLKIIQAILHFSPKLVKMWRLPLMNLINLARRDSDEWVETVADMFRDFPEKGNIQCLPTNKDSYFYTTLDELQKLVKEKIQQTNAPSVLPPDCEILSLNVIKSQFGYSKVEQKKHFNVNKNLKSQQLLEEVRKIVEFQNNPIHKKNNGIISSFPIKMRSTIRKPNNDLPMKGIPSTSASKISGGFTNESKKFQRQLLKREGGAMLIDITELPQLIGKKRRISESVSTTPKCSKKINDTLSSNAIASTSVIDSNNKATTQSSKFVQKLNQSKNVNNKKVERNTKCEQAKNTKNLNCKLQLNDSSVEKTLCEEEIKEENSQTEIFNNHINNVIKNVFLLNEKNFESNFTSINSNLQLNKYTFKSNEETC